MSGDGCAISETERDNLFECFAGFGSVCLAVSGGADSTAMLHLVSAWRHSRENAAPAITVATVDHRLRPASATEARRVAADCADLGLPHTTLTWDGPKPARGIQAAARAARYRLLGRFAKNSNAEAVATAHTLDDQAETLLMRLARGSGADGLSAMKTVSRIDGMTVLRPLLGVSRRRIIATLQQRGIAWTEDPSNGEIEFERVRWRRAAGALAELGLTPPPLALSAHRLGRARAALDAVAADAAEPGRGIVGLDPLGYARIDWPKLLDLPAEIRLRILARAIACVGGGPEPVPLAGLEAITEGQAWRQPVGRTLGRVAFRAGRGCEILLLREPGRKAPDPIILRPGDRHCFDGRFAVSVAKCMRADITVATLQADGLRGLSEAAVRRPPAPAAVLRMLPGFWHGETLVAVPALGYIDANFELAHFFCAFTNRLFAERDRRGCDT